MIYLDLGFLKLKDNKNVSNPLNLLIKLLIEKSMHRIRILKARQHEQNCLQTDLTMNQTKPFNSETSMRIRIHYQIKKEIGISVARAKAFI